MGTCGSWDLGGIKDLFSPIVSLKENITLTKTLSASKIKETVFQIGPQNCFGLDGFPAIFYQHIGESIGHDIPPWCMISL